MCGISGVISFTSNYPKQGTINLMVKNILHRGPDAHNTMLYNRIALGHTRLSILDLSESGNQPFYSTDRNYIIVFNGEIYNYIELKKELEINFNCKFTTSTDTEVLLQAYIHWGENCLHKLNGMFSFAIYNSTNDSLFCARDRFGVKPFYYYLNEEKLIFASEPKAILSVLNKKPNADYQRIYDYLIFNRTDHDSHTFFEGIQKLPHGHTLTVTENKVTIKKWYDLRNESKTSLKNSSEFRELLKSAISIRLRSDVPIGLTLSGGLDSSSIASSLIEDFNNHQVNTFSAVYGENKKGDESKFINVYKDKLPNMHFVSPNSKELLDDLNDFIETQQEPFGTTSIYANYKIMKEANKTVRVMLNGQGADEYLAGYHYFYGNYYYDLFISLKWFTLLKEMITYIKNNKSLFAIKSFVFYLLPSAVQSNLKVKEKKVIRKDFIDKYKKSSNVPKKIFGKVTLFENLINHFEYKLEHLLKWDDRNSMRFGIESRNPFLDYRLVQQTISTPNSFKIKNGITKIILREAFKDILPNKIAIRKDKIGFSTPEDDWFRTPEFQKIIFEILNSSSFKNRNIINPTLALEQYKAHLNKKTNISTEIWKWINLELWFRKYID
jgi:asparagine synthase (glutamine-hydrolysing)